MVPPFDLAGRQVRSAEIRERIAVGDLDGAAALLGRPVSVVGDVMREPASAGGAVAGQLSAELAFRLPVSLPPEGRYAVMVEPPLTLGRAGAATPAVAAQAVIGDGRVRIAGSAALTSERRLRVAFPL